MPKYRICANLFWDLEGTNSQFAKEKAMEQLVIMANSVGIHLHQPTVSVNKSKNSGSHNKILAEYPPDEILNQLRPTGERKEFKIGDVAYEVRMNSERYFAFRENKKCVSCGIVGTKMLLELPYDSKFPHFNLYAEENGRRVLMTKDHKIPVARDGKDVMENYQTMCAICNNIKGKDIIHLDDLKILRDFYNKGVKNGIPSTRLHHLVQEEKIKLMAKRTSSISTTRKRGISYRLLLILLICIITIGVSIFNPVYAVLGLVLSILGYSAGTLR